MTTPVAVVAGLCAHGLAITRSLSRAGIDVVAIETNRSLPGIKTCTADVVIVDDINGSGLVRALVGLAPTISTTTIPILFLTNDTMIETVGNAQDELGRLYRISWAHSRTGLLPLLRKEHVYARCMETKLLHPKSRLVCTVEDIANEKLDLRFPLIFKPNRPISGYKTLVIEDEEQLQKSWTTIERSLPAIAQEFIPGDESRTRFAALYLDHGQVLARFEGRKLRSRPMGHTTVAIGEPDENTHLLARKFFAGLDFSGPVSLEMKEDPEGKLWIIEPTVGRSDFWVGLCIAEGVDLPLIEYRQECGHLFEGSSQQGHTLWINGERDPAALIWLMLRHPHDLLRRHIVGVYLHTGDYRPFFRCAARVTRVLLRKAVRKFT